MQTLYILTLTSNYQAIVTALVSIWLHISHIKRSSVLIVVYYCNRISILYPLIRIAIADTVNPNILADKI